MGDKEGKEKHFSLLGLLIERKTDVLALTAFLISVLTLLSQLGGAIIGPKLSVLQPNNVMVFKPSCDDREAAAFALHNNFVNEGADGQTSVVKGVFIAFERENDWHISSMTNDIRVVRNLVKDQSVDELCQKIELGVFSIHKFYSVLTDRRATPFIVNAGSIASPTHLYGTIGKICKKGKPDCDSTLRGLRASTFSRIVEQKDEATIKIAYAYDDEITVRSCSFSANRAPANAPELERDHYRLNFFENYGFLIMRCETFETESGPIAAKLKKFVRERI